MNKPIAHLLGLITLVFILSGCNSLQFQTGEIDELPETEAAAETSPTDVEVKLERNDWSTIWIENANQTDLPRMLLVGDSITEGYYSAVKENLSEVYFPARYTTSKFLSNPDFQTELITILDRYDFEVIILNNGLHGWDYSLAEYRAGLEDLVQLLEKHAPSSRLIWCLTTPVRAEGNLESLDSLNQEVIRRNHAAREVMEQYGIPILDLYGGMLGHPEYYKADGFHFNDKGREVQAELITEFIINNR